MKLVTILIPCYNEEKVLDQLLHALYKVTNTLKNYQFEFLFVNDGSQDKTLKKIKNFHQADPRVTYVDLSRNFGKEVAMLAGMDYARGDAVITMDADLQHPPEKIKEMLYWWEQGHDDIYTVRENRKEAWFKKWSSRLYYKILKNLTKENVYPNSGDFRLLDRKCIEALTSMRESERYTKAMYGWIGYKKKKISYVEHERIAGRTKWRFRQLFKLAIDGITSYSTVPLKLSSYLGFIISIFAFIYLLYEIVKILINGPEVAGYGTLLAAVLFMGGIQLISLGIIGEYLSRIFIESKQRPVYLVRESSHQVDHKLKVENKNIKKDLEKPVK